MQLAVIDSMGAGVRVRRSLEQEGDELANTIWGKLNQPDRDSFLKSAHELDDAGISLIAVIDNEYPSALLDLPSAPPFLFVKGNAELLRTPGIGMCGSRHVSDRGIGAAQTCGGEVARLGMPVVSGYAQGVDATTHLAALAAKGTTVIVLAEGIRRFRIKQAFRGQLDFDRTVVISQFAPDQRWSVGGAMTRNGVIAALSQALVVIEAGPTGGTLNAGRQALGINRPVLTLEFSDSTPEGNRILLREGAVGVHTPRELTALLPRVERLSGPVQPAQIGLFDTPE
ncbi:MAG: DNA-processing protein DprA [Actinobacteria bacterium]|nr:DNA-processing protein DprA [Actinomycetota bacterium]